MGNKKEAKSTEKPARKPRSPVFKTLGGRVSFVMTLSAVAYLGIAAYTAFELRRAYRQELLAAKGGLLNADSITWNVALVAILLTISALLLTRVLADFIIARRVRRLVKTMIKVVNRELDPEMLTPGMGELDGITDFFSHQAETIRTQEKTREQEIKERVSMAELNQGMTELQMARLEALLASMGEGVVATDREGLISFINRVARRALWWQTDSVQEVGIFQAYQLETEDEHVVSRENWPIWEAIDARKTVITPSPTKPYYLRTKQGHHFPVRLVITPVTLNQEVVGAIVVFADITEEVEFDNRKSEFISIASHQLRSPSSAIKMMADMFRKGDFGPLTDTQQEWMEKLYIATDGMIELVNTLLNISRVEAGVKMRPELTETGEFVQKVLAQEESILLEKKQQFAYEPVALPDLVFDRFMVSESLKNYITNAAKYSPEGSSLGVSVKPEGTMVRFSVTDKGIGIPEKDKSQMFNKFFRAQNAVSEIIKGTGLGLYYVKQAIEKHGGEVGFDSVEGQGSTFWFTLPIETAPEVAAKQVEASPMKAVQPAEKPEKKPDERPAAPEAKPEATTPPPEPPTASPS
jgi:PAS domain S-box-containing protein